MVQPIILASGSPIRAQMLQQANVAHQVVMPRIDELAIKEALIAEGAKSRDIADALAEMKARKISEKHPGALVIGCDQILDHHGKLLSKPRTPVEAVAQLASLRGDRHSLLSAVVICENGKPVWRQVGHVRLEFRKVGEPYLADYVDRNWESIQHAVGGYKLEEEGVRLFSRIEGDYFHVLGMPLLELLNYLTLRGAIVG